MPKNHFQIAIDGPAGAGKSTIAKLLAKKLNFTFINTGSMYRCIALWLEMNHWKGDQENLKKLLNNLEIDLQKDQYFLNGKNVTNQITTQAISKLASEIALENIVRQKCVAKQQSIASKYSVVMEGRDIGSVVLPNATLKIFLTASIKNRAKRRKTQFNCHDSLEKIQKEIAKRDQLDTNRAISPLKKTDDAILLDTDNLSIEAVVDQIYNLFQHKIVNN